MLTRLSSVHHAPLLRVRPLLPATFTRCFAKKTDKNKVQSPQFGNQHAGDDSSASQGMHDIGKGRWSYVGDFVSSMNKGPVKVDFGKPEEVSEKQKAIDELNERNLKLIQRSLVLGSAAVLFAGIFGWQFAKWWYGVKNVSEFGEVMKDKMPKVSGKLEDSAIGRKLHETADVSRDAISENPELTDWRRSLRGKFNTEEGAALARKNSILMAERREMEKLARKSTKTAKGSEVAPKADEPDPVRDEAVEAALAAAAAATEAVMAATAETPAVEATAEAAPATAAA